MNAADLRKPHVVTSLAVSEPEAARMLGVSARTMFNWRASGTGPRAVRAGSRVLYAVDELRRWLDASAMAPAGVEQPALQAMPASPAVQAVRPAEQAQSPAEGGGR